MSTPHPASPTAHLSSEFGRGGLRAAPFLPTDLLRAHEAALIARGGPDFELRLVRSAGRALAAEILDLLRRLPPSAAADGVLFFTGKGNNAADAFAAAPHLLDRSVPVRFVPAAPDDALRGTARTLRALLPPTVPFLAPTDVPTAFAGLWVDALLGSGARGVPAPPYAALIRLMNTRPAGAPLLAVDLPSGLMSLPGIALPDEATNPADPVCVRADFTLAMAAPKTVQLLPASRDWVGSLRVAPIPELEPLPPPPDASAPLLVAPPVFPPLPAAAHKFSRGAVLLVGGSADYPGAIVLAAEAACRSGAGLVRVSASAPAVDAVLARAPQVVARPDLFSADPAKFDAVLFGPGLVADENTRRALADLLRTAACPVVLDAAALRLLADEPSLLDARPPNAPVILTPHPGELAALLHGTVPEIQADRPAAARRAAALFRAVVVLKGDATLVASPDPAAPLLVNLCGNPGLATAGSGDVLAGLLAGLLAQHLPVLEATAAAVHLHARAADRARLALRSPRPLQAPDLPPHFFP